VQVTLWQLSREKSLIAKRSKIKGNSGHTSKANFGSDICQFESSHPSQPVPSLQAIFRSAKNLPVRKLTTSKRGSPWTPDMARTEARRLLVSTFLRVRLARPSLWPANSGLSALDWWLCGASLRSPFSNFRFGIPETGSIWDGTAHGGAG
jgi:hypothetical protein